MQLSMAPYVPLSLTQVQHHIQALDTVEARGDRSFRQIAHDLKIPQHTLMKLWHNKSFIRAHWKALKPHKYSSKCPLYVQRGAHLRKVLQSEEQPFRHVSIKKQLVQQFSNETIEETPSYNTPWTYSLHLGEPAALQTCEMDSVSSHTVENSFMEDYQNSFSTTTNTESISHHQSSLCPLSSSQITKLEMSLVSWTKRDIPGSPSVIKDRAQILARRMGLHCFKPSLSWAHSFRKNYCL